MSPAMEMPGCNPTMARARLSPRQSCARCTTTTRYNCFRTWLISQHNSSYCSGHMSDNTLVRQHRCYSEGNWILHATAQARAKPSDELWRSTLTFSGLVHCRGATKIILFFFLMVHHQWCNCSKTGKKRQDSKVAEKRNTKERTWKRWEKTNRLPILHVFLRRHFLHQQLSRLRDENTVLAKKRLI